MEVLVSNAKYANLSLHYDFLKDATLSVVLEPYCALTAAKIRVVCVTIFPHSSPSVQKQVL